MIKLQWLKLPISQTNLHGPNDVWVIEVRLYTYHNVQGPDFIACFLMGGNYWTSRPFIFYPFEHDVEF